MLSFCPALLPFTWTGLLAEHIPTSRPSMATHLLRSSCSVAQGGIQPDAQGAV